MSEQPIRVLMLDDEASLRKPLSEYLESTSYGFKVDQAETSAEALRLLGETHSHYDVALIDEVLTEPPGGLDVVKEIKAKYPDIEVILFTGWGMKSGEEARRIGAYSYIAKPFDRDQLAVTIYNAAERKRIRREHRYMEALVTASRALTQTTNPDEQLNLVWNFVRGQLQVSTFWIALYDPESDTIHFPVYYDKDEPVHRDSRVLGQDRSTWGLAGYVVKTAQEVSWSSHERGQEVCQTIGIKPLQVGDPCQSCFSIPLQAESKRVLGALSIQSYQRNAFDPALLNAVRALGNQVVVALENSRLMTETKQKARNLETLQELTIAINSTLELKQVLSQTCRAAVELTRADHSGLVVFGPDLASGNVFAEYPPTDRTLGQTITVRGISAEERLVFEQQVINIPELTNDTSLGSVRDLLLDLGIRSIVIVPVIFDGKVVASFSLDAMNKPRTFSKSEIEICQSLANQAAVAIRNAHLFKETDEGRKYLQSLYQATTEIISPRDPNEVLQNIVATACRTTGAWRAVILLIEASGRPRTLASFGFDHRLDLAESIRPAGISMQVVRSGEPQFIPDTEAEAGKVNPAMLAQGSKAAVCLPLKLFGGNIGVLWLQFHDKHTFSKTERHALQLYANQSAIAYDNARRMQELEQLKSAADAMASKADWKDVLQEIAKNAKQVLGADYTLIWPYDAERKIFFPEDLVAENIPYDLLEKFRQEEPHPGSTTERVLQDKYVAIAYSDSAWPDFVGETTRGFLETLKVKSFQGIRLDIAGEPLGVLFVDYAHARGFGEEDRRILEHFANHAALTLKKARLYEQLRRSQAAARAIAQAGALGDLDQTLGATVEGACAVLRCDIATIYAFDEDKSQFVRETGTGYFDKRNLCPSVEVNTRLNSAPWKIIQLLDEYYYLSEDAPNDVLLKGNFIKAEKVNSALGIQLRFGERRVGVMFINYRTSHRFTQDEIDDALLFANQATVAIHNAQLHDETRKRVEVMRGLYEAGKAITRTLSLEETLNHIAEQALHVVGASSVQEKCFTHIALRAGNKLRFEAAYPGNMLEFLKKHIEIDLHARGNHEIGIAGRCVNDGRPQKVGDVSKDPDYRRAVEHTKSQLSVPLKVGSDVIGVVSVERPELNAFTDEDVQNLESLAAQAAVAIQNARRYENLQTMKALIGTRTATEWMKMVSYAWGHAIKRETGLALRYVKLIRQDWEDGNPSQANQDLSKLVDVIERIKDIPIVAPLAKEDRVTRVSVNSLLRGHVARLWQHDPYRSANLTWALQPNLDDIAIVVASPQWILRAVEIFLSNSIEAMTEANSLIRQIGLATQLSGNTVEILVKDSGPGFPAHVPIDKIGIDPISKPEGSRGAGLGLVLAKLIAQTYGGDIRVVDSSSKGAIMCLSLPCSSP